MPLLARMVGVPLAVDIRAGAVGALAPLLADARISTGGRVAVAVGPGQGEEIASIVGSTLERAQVLHVSGGTLESAQLLAAALRQGSYDAVVGIGGGRLLDTAKWAATMTGLPMVACATNLAHDGIASPVASLEQDGRKSSHGVQMPLGVIVDLDYVRRSPARMRRSGVGDVVSNLSAVADWELAAGVLGESVDGIAITISRTAAMALVQRTDSIDDDAFLTALAEALVLSGLAMAVAGSSRPCSGGDHELLHAVDELYPGTSNHGELAGVGALFMAFLREDDAMQRTIDDCLLRHSLPRVPADLQLSSEQFVQAVLHAPTTRPGRYTVLEHLGMDEKRTRMQVKRFEAAFSLGP